MDLVKFDTADDVAVVTTSSRGVDVEMYCTEERLSPSVCRSTSPAHELRKPEDWAY